MIFLNFLAALLYSIESYSWISDDPLPQWCRVLSSICLVFFAADFVMHLLAARSRLLFLLSMDGLVDVITFSTFFVPIGLGRDVFIGGLYFLRPLKVFRSFNILGFSTRPSPEWRLLKAILLLVHTSFAIIYCSGAMLQFLERILHSQNLPLDMCFYGIIVTISTVGFGDVVAKTLLGRLMIIAVIFITAIVIPLEGAWIVDILDAFRPSRFSGKGMCAFPMLYCLGA